MSSALRISLCVCVCALGIAAAQDRAEMRHWEWQGGKFKAEARLITVERGFVKLKRADGKDQLVPLQLLSEKDRQYVEGFLAQAKPQPQAKAQPLALDPAQIPDGDEARIALARETREWQKPAFGNRELEACLARLRGGDANARKHAMTQLAIVKPDVARTRQVVDLAKAARPLVGDDFYRHVYPQICDTWEGAMHAQDLQRQRGRGIAALEQTIRQGSPLEANAAIVGLQFQFSAQAAEALTRISTWQGARKP